MKYMKRFLQSTFLAKDTKDVASYMGVYLLEEYTYSPDPEE